MLVFWMAVFGDVPEHLRVLNWFPTPLGSGWPRAEMFQVSRVYTNNCSPVQPGTRMAALGEVPVPGCSCMLCVACAAGAVPVLLVARVHALVEWTWLHVGI